MKEVIVIKGRPALAGVAEGYAMVCPNSIQGWAGIDPRSGKILEKGHVHEGETYDAMQPVCRCCLILLPWLLWLVLPVPWSLGQFGYASCRLGCYPD